MKKYTHAIGFSLTEMSIVIVIIGFLVAATLSGRGLIDNAKLKAIIAEVGSHKVSVNSFISKYDEFPGDFTDAVAYWGGSTSNGDGNGKIEFANTAGTPVYEGYRAWQHLSYASMTNGQYAGTETTGAAVLDTDVPPSKASSGGFFFEYGIFGVNNYNMLALGVPVATAAAPILVNGVLTPKQAHEIDSKMDDGEPRKGAVRGQDGNGSTAQSCLDDGADATVKTSDDFYSLQSDGKDCTLAFKMISQ